MNNNYLNHLNSQQKKAVENNNKFLLVIAAAGTGKTRVLVSKFLYILNTYKKNNKSINIYNIMALTFTNKAAKEMLTRIGIEGGLYVGTFHSICLRLLRQFSKINYTIIDEDDSKKILLNLNYNPDMYMYIKQMQDKGILPEELENYHMYKELYLNYNLNLKKQNLLDFGSIILETIKLLINDTIGNQIRQQFTHVLVDEYQDTSLAQEKLLQLLTKDNINLFCVGDPQQSVYEWRGAHRDNILNFKNRYIGSEIIKLNENYRSTKEILNFATNILENNNSKKIEEKNIIIGQYHGEKVKIYSTNNIEQEGRFIASKIHQLITEGYNYKDIAILARSNLILRNIEQSLNISSIPYKVYSGIKFFERDEIKTIISYIRLIFNSKDILAFERVVQNPKKGIGLKSIQELKQFIDPLSSFSESKLSKKVKETLQELKLNILRWKEMLLEEKNLTFFILKIIEDVKLNEYYREQNRINNLKQFAELAGSFNSLEDIINSIIMNYDNAEEDKNVISLMTIHMSKGLEFPIVFLTACSEGFFPSPKSVSEGKVEEEIRLAYVAITRAKSLLYITTYKGISPSRFLKNTYNLADNYKIYE